MTLKSYSKLFVMLLSLAYVSRAAYNYYRQKKSKPIKKREIHEVIMFPNNSGSLKRSKYSKCMLTPSVERVLFYLCESRHTLDICMYVMTNTDICNALLKCFYKNVHIRVIVDADMAYSNNSMVRRFLKNGIQVRWMKSTNLMHHKFCVIDGSVEDSNTVPFVICGSLNWTNQALSGNWEDVIVTSQKELVRSYKEEFEKLWILFKPIVEM